MRELGSGILGSIICVVALMGSIFGAFCFDVDAETREVTAYDYKTDLTGTFATDQAPEYIDYNPNANFIGYSRNSINYTQTNVANSYRYVASYPNDTTISSNTIRNTDFFAPSRDFLTCSPNEQLVLNVNDGTYNYGSSRTVNGITYNVFNNLETIYEHPNSIKVTQLYNILNQYRSYGGSVTIDITNHGDHPVLMSTTPPRTELNEYSQKHWRFYYANITSYPTRIVWNTTIDSVDVYHGSTLMFSSTLTDTIVYYSYQYNAGGTPVQANVNATFQPYARTIKVDGISSSDTYPPPYENSLIIYNTVPNRGYPTTPYGTVYGRDYNMAGFGVSPITSVFAATSDLATSGIMTIEMQYFANAFADTIIFRTNEIEYHSIMSIATATSANYPSSIDYNVDTGACTVHYGNSQTYTCNINDLVVVYAAKDADSLNDFTVYTNFLYSWTPYIPSTNVTNNQSYPHVNALIGGPSTIGTSVLIDWNGSDRGWANRTYDNITYELSVPRVTDSTNVLVSTLYHVLEDMGIESFNSVDLTVSYGTNPILIYGGTFGRNDVVIGNSTQYVYTATLNENNAMPDRIVILDGTAQLYKDNVLISTKSINEVYVIYRYYAKPTGSIYVSNQGTSATFSGTATTSEIAVILSVDNNSSYPSDAYTFAIPEDDPWLLNEYRYAFPLINYTGTAYNMGTPVFINNISQYATFSLTDGSENNNTVYVTKLTNILNSLDLQNVDSVDVSITYGTHPMVFIKGDFNYYYAVDRINEQGGSFTYKKNYYWMEIDDNSFPDRLVYDKITDRVTLYRNGQEIYHENSNKISVIYKYWTSAGDLTTDEVTDQSMLLSGKGYLHPTYAYADPTKGVVLKTPFTIWSNGYKNNEINITVTKQNWGNNDLTITAGTSKITIERRSAGGMYVTVEDYQGNTDTKDLGKWYSAQITINADEKWVAVTPIAGSGMPNFTSSIELNDTTIIWDDWYNGGNIENLTFSTTDTSMRWSVTKTSVFLNTYGIVMSNPSVNVTDYFPEMEEWRLNFFSFALIGDSMTINNQTFPVDIATQTITLTDVSGKTVSGELSNIYISQENEHTYFSFANSNKTVDLGETVSDTVSFTGLWYFTTGLFDVTESTEQYYNWNVDGTIHATIPQICLIFVGILIAGLIISKALLKMEFGAIDWIILISATVLSLIIAGGTI